jgi:hypothetical protein
MAGGPISAIDLKDSQGNLVPGFIPPSGPAGQALVDYINPQTGQRVTAPSGGYTPPAGFVQADSNRPGMVSPGGPNGIGSTTSYDVNGNPLTYSNAPGMNMSPYGTAPSLMQPSFGASGGVFQDLSGTMTREQVDAINRQSDLNQIALSNRPLLLPDESTRPVTPNPINFLPSEPIAINEADAKASQIDKTISPFLTEGLRQAQEIFLRQQPQMFPNQTYISPSEQTLTALRAQENIARGPAPTLQAAQGAFLRGLTEQSAAAPMYQNIYGAAGYQPGAQTFEQAAAGGLQNIAGRQLQDIAGGSMLNANPYQQQMMQAATRPLEQQFSQQVLPGISSLYSKSGRLGSGAMERALGTATEGFGRALGDVTSNLAGSQFQAERGLQQQALGQLAGVSGQDIQTRLYGAQGLQGAQQAALATQLQAAGGVGTSQYQELQRQLSASAAAPQIYAQQFLPSQQLAQIGAQREAISAQPLQEQMARFAYQQRLPYEQLSGYLSSVYGSPLGSFGTPAPQPQFTNSTVGALGGALGGGIGGYALGSMLPSSFLGGYGGAAGGALGAIGGGLLGGGYF